MKIIVCNYNFKKFMNFLFFLNYENEINKNLYEIA